MDYIIQRIDENLTYDYLHSSEDNLWSMLYLTGYLTKLRENDYEGELLEGTMALIIPNAEIKEIFETTVIKWFDDSAKKWNRNALFDAVWNGDSERITKEMNSLLRRTISYHDYKEDFYHAFLAGIFTGAGYMVDSNKEHGEGRSDVVVLRFYQCTCSYFLKQNIRKFWIIWKMNVILHYNRSMIECMLRNTKMIMMRFYAMGFHFSKSDVW